MYRILAPAVYMRTTGELFLHDWWFWCNGFMKFNFHIRNMCIIRVVKKVVLLSNYEPTAQPWMSNLLISPDACSTQHIYACIQTKSNIDSRYN